MHSVRVASRTREASTEMNAACARKRLLPGLGRLLIWPVGAAASRVDQRVQWRLETESSRTV